MGAVRGPDGESRKKSSEFGLMPIKNEKTSNWKEGRRKRKDEEKKKIGGRDAKKRRIHSKHRGELASNTVTHRRERTWMYRGRAKIKVVT